MNRSARRAAVLVLTAAAALAGCATTTAGSGTPALGATAAGDPTTLPIPSGSGTPAPTPTVGGDSTPARTTTPAPAPTAAGQTARVGSVTVPVPAGSTAKVQGDFLCLTLQNATGCSLEVIDIGRIRAEGGSVSTPAPGEPNGWWWGSDVPSCGDETSASAVTRSTVVEKGFKKVGPKNAVYGSWLVSCQNGDQDFDPRLWWLPASQVAFRERTTVAGSGEAVDRILAGVTFQG